MATSAPYLLRQLAADVSISADSQTKSASITCVEVWNGNLYIGTSAAEVLHFVLIPPDPDDTSGDPAVILASRQQPPFNHASPAGVQQILLLPSLNKACILCNNTLSFYSLPELSPAFTGTKPLPCVWVGGIDLNLDSDGHDSPEEAVIMICQKSRIRLVRVSEEGPRGIRSIEFGGCLTTMRRETVACVADSHAYALLDVEHQQKIPLFPISSLDEEALASISGTIEDIPQSQSEAVSRSVSSASTSAKPAFHTDVDRGHGRSSSLGIFGSGDPHRAESPRPHSSQRYGFDVPASLSRIQSPGSINSPERTASPAPTADKPLPVPPGQPPSSQQSATPPKKSFVALRPHIASPTPEEFLLVTGTSPSEPGVGMFVNLDGDVVRGTIEFGRYPDALVVDGTGWNPAASATPGQTLEEGYVLYTTSEIDEGTGEKRSAIEMQRWDLDPGEAASSLETIDLELGDESVTSESASYKPGIRKILTSHELKLSEIVSKLSLRRLDIGNSAEPSHTGEEMPSDTDQNRTSSDAVREKEEAEFTSRLSIAQARLVVWAGDRIWWAIRNPSIIRLDAVLDHAQAPTADSKSIKPNRSEIETLLADIRGQEPQTELDFLGLGYIRQKASVLLLMDLIIRTICNIIVFDREIRLTEEALVESGADPRIVLTLLPPIREEVIFGANGIWTQGGLKELVEKFLKVEELSRLPTDPSGPLGDNLLHLLKRFLIAWRRKKGFGSIPNEKEVFQTVDAALVRVLLLLDSQSPRGGATAGSIRAELNSIIDNGVDCFDRVVTLLEESKRLYLLSRLYQSRKLSSKVLATWRRMIDGEYDAGGEFTDGEQEVRKYLSRIRDRTVVEEYGLWLANKNPKLGVQVFADDSSRVTFEPAEAVALLKENAPGAVKDYLEHLVFGKKHVQYANDLITFYLDIVLTELQNSETSKSILLQTYETYRALHPPKPTYRQFVTDNASEADWWTSRLRLLQLLGSSQSESFSYDVAMILERLAPFEKELVPEMIILNGRQGHHEDAIRLLTHGLGDFDTAIRYCLLGGSNIFHAVSGFVPQEAIPAREEQSRLFGYLLHEFLQIENLNDRIERTGELLERFGGWFDIGTVLSMIPDSWSIDIFSGFLINALRRLVRERSETAITKALNSSQNLKVQAELINRIEDLGVSVERTQ